jgi:hypothetical protein
LVDLHCHELRSWTWRDLTEYLPIIAEEKFYAIEYPDGRPRTRYPIGPSLLAAPVVVVYSWLHPRLADELRAHIPVRTEQFIASLVGAAAGAIFFWVIFSQFQSILIASLSTFIFAFCTSIWSTATRALWQHGPLVLMLVLIFALSGFVLALRDQEQRGLYFAYGAIVVAHVIIVGASSMWWAGHSFGPRFTTGIVPFLVYFTAFNFRLPSSIRPSARSAVFVGVAVLTTASFLIHAQGALRRDTWMWNVIPNNIDDNASRAWDWRDPQFARTDPAPDLR